MTLRLATRRSPLAMIQARLVQQRLYDVDVESELVPVETTGDRDTTSELSVIGGQGVFAIEVQRAVLRGDADVAVHSAKDLPSATLEGLSLACVPERLDAGDVLVGRSLAGLGPGATIATGSPRRRALLLERRPDLNVVSLRGNMGTRLRATETGGVDAIVCASAALTRLGEEQRIRERLDPQWFVPQVGQGALALECRSSDDRTVEVLELINDESAFRCVGAERGFLFELGAGCSLPVGAHARLDGDVIRLRGVMLAPSGVTSVRGELDGRDPHTLGRELAILLRDELGGGELLESR